MIRIAQLATSPNWAPAFAGEVRGHDEGSATSLSPPQAKLRLLCPRATA